MKNCNTTKNLWGYAFGIFAFTLVGALARGLADTAAREMQKERPARPRRMHLRRRLVQAERQAAPT
ncbi:MAG: hypothetical protein ABI743_10035 [bacterium]